MTPSRDSCKRGVIPLRKAERTVLGILGQCRVWITADELHQVLVHTRSGWWKVAAWLPFSFMSLVCSRLVKKGFIQVEQRQLYHALRPGEEGPARHGGTITVYSITEKGRNAFKEYAR